MKIRIITDDAQIELEDRQPYNPDVLDDMLKRGVADAIRLQLTLAAAAELADEAPPVGSEPIDD